MIQPQTPAEKAQKILDEAYSDLNKRKRWSYYGEPSGWKHGVPSNPLWRTIFALWALVLYAGLLWITILHGAPWQDHVRMSRYVAKALANPYKDVYQALAFIPCALLVFCPRLSNWIVFGIAASCALLFFLTAWYHVIDAFYVYYYSMTFLIPTARGYLLPLPPNTQSKQP